MSSFGFDPFAFHKEREAQPPSERLMNGASIGKVDEIISALDEGADPNFKRIDVAPSLIATIREHLDCLRTLLERGARWDIPNRGGWTALHEAAAKETTDFLDVIIEHKNDSSMMARDMKGTTAMLVAMDNNRRANAERLAAAEPHLLAAENHDGVSPVFWAVQHKDAFWLAWVLERDAEAPLRTRQGKTPLEEAEEGDWAEGVEVLIAAQTRVQAAKESDERMAGVDKSDPAALWGALSQAGGGFGADRATAVRTALSGEVAPSPAAAPSPTAAAEPAPAAPANPFGLGGVRRPKR